MSDGTNLAEIIYIAENRYLAERFIKRFSEDLRVVEIKLIKIDIKNLRIVLDDFVISAVAINGANHRGYRNAKYFINSVCYSWCDTKYAKERMFYELQRLIKRFPKEVKAISEENLIRILKEELNGKTM